MAKLRFELTGQRFHHMLVLEHAGGGRWRCRCDCGREKVVGGASLRDGTTRSCRCGLARRSSGRNRLGRVTPEGKAYDSMMGRCHNPRNKDYARYGGRGIVVCERWRASFSSFLEDMGPRPAGASIERVNNDVGYEPGNCVWADAVAQCNNRSSNHFLELGGRRMTIAQWSRELGIHSRTIAGRLARGLSNEEALTRPVDRGQSSRNAA
jgi:hypothetical protein